MTLARLQTGMRDWLVREAAGVETLLDPGGEEGLAVYQNNYRGQLMDCLAESFPKTLAWLGESRFFAATARFIDAQPPSSWTLDAYSAGFPAFLAGDLPDDPEAAELAGLEQALNLAFVGADAQPLTLCDLPEVDWDRARLRLGPTASVTALRSNACDIWLAIDRERPPPAAVVAAEARAVLVWRQDFTCAFRPVEADEAQCLSRLAGGAMFEDLCTALVEAMGPDAGVARAGALLAQWARDACLVVEV